MCHETPHFYRLVNPISIRGADYAHHINTGPPVFSDLPTALSVEIELSRDLVSRHRDVCKSEFDIYKTLLLVEVVRKKNKDEQ